MLSTKTKKRTQGLKSNCVLCVLFLDYLVVKVTLAPLAGKLKPVAPVTETPP
jgi:hypothetical protein